MLENPLLTLTENLSTVSEDISPAKAAYILSQILERVGYDEQPTENTVEEVSPSEREASLPEDSARQTSQEDAIKTLSEIISGVHSGKSYEEAIVTALYEVEEHLEGIDDQAPPLLLAEDRETLTQPFKVNEVDVIEEVVILNEEITVNHSEPNTEDIHRYVIPLILKRLIQEESTVKIDDGEGGYTKSYESQKFTVTLKVTADDEQLLTLDRNAVLENESVRALEATRESSKLKFEMIINNLAQQEIEQIKTIIQKEAQSAVQKVKQKKELAELG